MPVTPHGLVEENKGVLRVYYQASIARSQVSRRRKDRQDSCRILEQVVTSGFVRAVVLDPALLVAWNPLDAGWCEEN